MNEIVKSAPQPPVSLRRAAVDRLISAGVEPSPENLLKDSESEDAPLHDFFYQTPQELWIKFGRYEAARRVIQLDKQEFSRGGKKLQMRRIEAVKIGTIERWGTVEQIIASPELRDAYMKEIENGMEAYATKMSRLRELMRET